MSIERRTLVPVNDQICDGGSSASRGPVRAGRYDQRTRKLLEAPITPMLLGLALPNVVVLVAQASVGLIETYFIGKLGTDALAGVALVFPVVMLMQMMSGGAMGGGISSAVARALGAGRRDDADALSFHALADRCDLWFGFHAGCAHWRPVPLHDDGRKSAFSRGGAYLLECRFFRARSSSGSSTHSLM